MQMNPPLDTAIEKEIATQGGTIEFCTYNPRSKTGMRSWEVKIKNADGSRSVLVIRDSGVNVENIYVPVRRFATRAERNAEIYRLYTEANLSQVFLANFFGVTQPSISIIVKQFKNK